MSRIPILGRASRVAGLLAVTALMAQDAALAQGPIASETLNPAVETHVVEPGDTLWDLSERILGSPWLWPKVWSFNPEITNPHWIYPGDVIRFYPYDQDLPSQSELIADVREIPQEGADGEDEYGDEPETPDIEVIDTRPTRARSRTAFRRFVNLFVTPQELAEAGTLTNAVGDKLLLSVHDRVYLSLKGRTPSPGDRFMLYRTLGEVVHPVTAKRFGYMTQITGLASVESIETSLARARINRALVEVERGQYVTPLDESLMLEVEPRPAKNAVQGVVLALEFEGSRIAGEEQVLFVDAGSNAGLERGNVLQVASHGDPYTGDVAGMPRESKGRLIIIQAHEIASTCLITRSSREIEPGDEFVALTQL